MQKVTVIKSKATPLPMKDVDTDLIIPAQFLTSISRDGYGENLFLRLREKDPNFPTSQAKFAGSRILITETNFGCGSSREHAVWAIYDAGFRVLIGKSFADIFYSNSAKNGLLLITLPAEVIDELMSAAQSGDYVISADLEKQEVTLPDGKRFAFDFDPFRKHCMLNGLDDIEYIRSHQQDIDAFRRKQKKESPAFSTIAQV